MRRVSSLVFLATIVGLLGIGSPAQASHSGTVVLVDGADTTSDSGGCGDATNPCNTIQAGVDHANVGDTVQVAAGTYTENVAISKRLVLDGAGSGDTATDTIVTSAAASTPVVNLTAGGSGPSDRLVLRDLRLTGASGAGGNADSGARIQSPASGFVTFDNVSSIGNTGNGVAIDMGAGSTVTDVNVIDSTLSDNGNSGFRVPTKVSLYGLDVSNSHMDGNDGTGFTMFGNLLDASIQGSSFNGNGGSPTANLGMGISMHGFDSAVNTVDDLTITGSQFNENEGAHATNNVSSGIQFSARTGDQFSDISITDSEMTGNARHGLRLEVVDGTPAPVLQDVTVTNNDISGNGEVGVTSFSPPAAPSNVAINRNDLSGNPAGIANTTAGTFDGECNWWGSPDGPGGEGSGTGSTVSTGVDFEPYLVSSDLSGPCSSIPSLTANSNSVTVTVGQTATNSGTYTAASNEDVVISASIGTATKTGTNTGTWSWSHTPTSAGTQTVTITGDNGQVGTTSFTLNVEEVKGEVIKKKKKCKDFKKKSKRKKCRERRKKNKAPATPMTGAPEMGYLPND